MVVADDLIPIQMGCTSSRPVKTLSGLLQLRGDKQRSGDNAGEKKDQKGKVVALPSGVQLHQLTMRTRHGKCGV